MVSEKSSNGFVNLFDFEDIETLIKNKENKKIKSINNIDNAFICKSLLSEIEVNSILKIADEQISQPVGITGYVSEYKTGDFIGSYRASIFNEYLADIIFQRLKKSYPSNRDFLNSNTIDHDYTNDWVFIGVNPLFRFINYKEGGCLIPHYDAPYIKNHNERTLVTVIIYLTTNKEDGSTRFIKDKQDHISCYERNLDDWKRKASKNEIIEKVSPIIGDALIFDHRTLHDSDKTIKNKIIIRTDLIFTRGNDVKTVI